MSVTKKTLEVSNFQKEHDKYEKSSLYLKTTEILNTFIFSSNDYNLVYISLIILWVVFTVLSIKESVKCDNKYIYMALSLVPFVNVALYFSIYKICSPSHYNAPYAERAPDNTNRNGIGYVNSMFVYPSAVHENNRNVRNNNRNNNRNVRNNKNVVNNKITNGMNPNNRNPTNIIPR